MILYTALFKVLYWKMRMFYFLFIFIDVYFVQYR